MQLFTHLSISPLDALLKSLQESAKRLELYDFQNTRWPTAAILNFSSHLKAAAWAMYDAFLKICDYPFHSKVSLILKSKMAANHHFNTVTIHISLQDVAAVTQSSSILPDLSHIFLVDCHRLKMQRHCAG